MNDDPVYLIVTSPVSHIGFVMKGEMLADVISATLLIGHDAPRNYPKLVVE